MNQKRTLVKNLQNMFGLGAVEEIADTDSTAAHAAHHTTILSEFFICFDPKDAEFARTLHRDLTAIGVSASLALRRGLRAFVSRVSFAP